ncbi:MAG: lecithin retinol acyltransferase family protein [Leptolyngbyaceae cyanobacterium bins.59]|nr:lecithin retinol acyltransferase family protein [Leptolyngbyaceae cyanobacterium bins.59]
MAKGDQIYVIREFLNLQGVYEHHGIDCGDGTVIHYQKLDEATVSRTSLDKFRSGRMVYVKNYPVSFIPDVVVRRAESRLGEQQYNLLSNNCEHFATWCKTGKNDSPQVRDFVPSIGTLGVYDMPSLMNQAIGSASSEGAPALVVKALADAQTARQSLQPELDRLQKEMDSWQQVALSALKQGREDLARAALARKYPLKKRATDLKLQVSQLDDMVKALQRNRSSIITPSGNGTQLL